MGIFQLIRIDPDGKETILEETLVPENFTDASNFFCSREHIVELEKHYKKTGKPKKRYIDAIYVCRLQVERWDDAFLERYAPSLESAKLELNRRGA